MTDTENGKAILNNMIEQSCDLAKKFNDVIELGTPLSVVAMAAVKVASYSAIMAGMTVEHFLTACAYSYENSERKIEKIEEISRGNSQD